MCLADKEFKLLLNYLYLIFMVQLVKTTYFTTCYPSPVGINLI